MGTSRKEGYLVLVLLTVGPWWVEASMFVGMWQMVTLLVSMDFISVESPIFFLFDIQNLLWMARK